MYLTVKPLVIAYIQCSLPLESLVDFIMKKFQPKQVTHKLRITAQDLFDMVLFESQEDVKALILERYSSIYPIPLLVSQYESKLT
jgi:hypothetical protein